MEKLEYLSATELGRLVNIGKIKPTEVIEYFKKRILERNSSINAFTYTMFDEAMEEAEKQEERLENGENLGPFAGVPFGLKDFLPSKKGWTNSHGGVECLKETDEASSLFTLSMEKLGGIAVGKCNAPAYGFRGTTDNKMYGATSTPFNTLYNAGGSSGGPAASVADGLTLIAEGGDAGGSIRIPASFNNLFGFKAGIGTIPSLNRPDAYSCSHPYCFSGGLTKTVEDAAVLLNTMSYYDPLDPLSRNVKMDFIEALGKPVKGMKIGYTPDFDIFEVEEETKNKFFEEIEKFKKLKVSLEPVHFNFKHSANELAVLWCKGITVDCAIDLNIKKSMGIDLLKDHKEDFPEEFIYYKNECDKMGIMDLYEYNLARTDILDEFERVFKEYDFIVSPVSAVPYILNSSDTKGPEEINGKKVESLIGWTETFLANFTGNPACSIPSGTFNNNVPFGLQIIGRRFEDEKLISLSSAYEKKFPWRETYKLAMERKINKK